MALVVFAWTGSSYADVSSQFKGFYRQVLQTLTQQPSAVSISTAGSQPQIETFQSQPSDAPGGINVQARLIRPQPASASQNCIFARER